MIKEEIIFSDNFVNELESVNRKFVVITDTNIAFLYEKELEKFDQLILQAGESLKSIAHYEYAIEELIDLNITKNDILVGIGGGTITDFTGFLSSTYKRGIHHINIPTTLLGMVDAAIGGKNALNINETKNLIGTFKPCEKIVIDTNFLKTLPKIEKENAMGEIVKYACISDKITFDEIDENNYLDIIQKCITIKQEIITFDPFEHSKRKYLNFGHTLAHALELTNVVKHGFAVAEGMKFAIYVSKELGYLTDEIYIKIKEYIDKTIDYENNFQIDANLIEVLKQDKKFGSDKIDFIVLRDIGEPEIAKLTIKEISELCQKYALV